MTALEMVKAKLVGTDYERYISEENLLKAYKRRSTASDKYSLSIRRNGNLARYSEISFVGGKSYY